VIFVKIHAVKTILYLGAVYEILTVFFHVCCPSWVKFYVTGMHIK